MGVTRLSGAGVLLGLIAGLACRAFSSPPTTFRLDVRPELLREAGQ